MCLLAEKKGVMCLYNVCFCYREQTYNGTLSKVNAIKREFFSPKQFQASNSLISVSKMLCREQIYNIFTFVFKL